MSFDPATRSRLLGLFVAEAEETVATLGGLSHALRDGAGAAELSEFGRFAHGLKGAAAALGFDRLALALHDLEDLALAIPRCTELDAAERHDRVARALELLGEGVARMAASGLDGFPGDLLEPLVEVVADPAARGGTGPAHGAGSASPAAPPPEAPVPAATAPAAPDAAGEERLSVPAADVDVALRLAASLARGAAALQDALAREGGPLAVSAQPIAASARALEAIISALRLLPADAALSGLDAEVGALAARLGKQVALAVTGGDVRADRRTLQAARGMIRHLVRNAIDHGFEPPERRRAAGKPEVGRLDVSVEAGESALRVTVADDGAGFDLVAIREELGRRGGDADRIATLSDAEVLQTWALEGGSTRASATQISGRGLGLSAVAQLARAAGGGIEVRSARGAGSRVAFTLPLEVYAEEVLAVSAGGRLFGVPLHAIDRTVHLPAARAAVHEGPAGPTLAVGEGILPLGSLAAALGIAPAAAERFALVVEVEAGMAALGVEDVLEVAGVVPVTVPGVAAADALVTGIARLGDGRVLSIVNPRLLLERARTTRTGRSAPQAEPGSRPVERGDAGAATPAPGRAALEVVLAEDSLATREVLRVLLEEQGFRVRLAADGEEALLRIDERVPDVLVTDVNMPRRDGLSLTRELRRRERTARLPVVLLTSQDDDATRAAGAAAGADAHLVKSRFNAAVLLETLARVGVKVPR